MRLEHRPDERIHHQLPEEARTAGPNAQNLWGRRLLLRRRSGAGRWVQGGQENHRQCM